jgi:Mg2+/Co2+ transporter CorB
MTDASPLFDLSFWLTCAVIALLILICGFCAGSETALTAVSRAKLRAQAERQIPGADRALAVAEDSERMIGTLLLGNNFVTILSAALATALMLRLFGGSGVAVATLGLTLGIVIFGVVLPRTISLIWPEAVVIRAAPAIAALAWPLSPPLRLIRAAARLLLRGLGASQVADARVAALRDDIVDAITLGASEGAVAKEDRDRLLGTLDLGRRTVDEIMRHRSRIEMIDADLPPTEILARALASPYTRLPLYRGEGENIIGVLHAKELLREVHRLRSEGAEIEALDLVKVAMKPYFVPDTTTLTEQMREFQQRRAHFALVVDEYGALQGLITLEDILEEIVGEITDETDVVVRGGMLRQAEDGDWLIDGTMTIRDLNRAMDWSLPDDEANTIAGLLIHEAMAIPEPGQVFRYHGFRFEVVQRRENRIAMLKLRRID